MDSLNGFRAVIFDMDGTLRMGWPPGGDSFADFAQDMGRASSHEDRFRAIRWDHYYWADSDEIRADVAQFGNDQAEAFWINYARRRLIALGYPPPDALRFAPQIQARMRAEYKPEEKTPVGIFETLEALRARDIVLGILSNREKPYDELVERLGLNGYFQFTAYSGEIDIRKPRRGIFDYTLQKTGTQPSETIYIGDNYFADVIGARNAGWTPVLYDFRGVFPDPDCAAISHYDQLIPLLNKPCEDIKPSQGSV
jgi:putative hydrolase of the HAD superfamily